MASVFYMGQIPKVTANTLMRIAGVSGKHYKKATWHSTTITVKQSLTVKEYIDTIHSIIQSCMTPDETCAVELLDFAIRSNVISSYAFVELPESLEDMFYIVYCSDLYETICRNSNSIQIDSIKETVIRMIG